MSMPSFPTNGTCISRCQALNMIIASIAMEEAALSRILDAGGNQLERFLNAPGTGESDTAALYRSIAALLESIRQNQIILKNKLEAALAEACSCEPPCKPPCVPPCRPPCEPPCRPPCAPPCEPPCRPPCEPPCRPPCEPPCGSSCESPCKPSCPPPRPCRPCAQPGGQTRPSIRLTSGPLTWEEGSALPWAQASQSDGFPAWNPRNPTLIRLDPKRAYLVRYTIRLAGGGAVGSSRWISLRTEPAGAFQGFPPRRFSLQALCRERPVLTDSGVLIPQGAGGTWAGLTVCLNDGKPLQVEQAELWVEEFF